MPRFEFDGERDRFAAKVGYRCNGTRIAGPPRIADEMLASKRQPDECLDIARVASERGKEPSLSLGAEVGTQVSLECLHGVGETFVDPKLRIRVDRGAAARLVHKQDMKHSGDLSRYVSLD